MKKICEMIVTDYFRLSTGHVALAGRMDPDVDELLSKCKAELYIGNQKIRTINIIGEDRFSGVNECVRQSRRAVRTTDPIYNELQSSDKEQIRLCFYND